MRIIQVEDEYRWEGLAHERSWLVGARRRPRPVRLRRPQPARSLFLVYRASSNLYKIYRYEVDGSMAYDDEWLASLRLFCSASD